MDENEMKDYWPDPYEYEGNNDTMPCNKVRIYEISNVTKNFPYIYVCKNNVLNYIVDGSWYRRFDFGRVIRWN